MNSRYILPFLSLILFAPLNANAAGSMLRVTCEGNDMGAEVLVNGKFRGECPIDLQVAVGTLKLQVRKKIDDEHDRVFEQEFRMGEDSVKKVDAVLSAMQLNAYGKKRENEMLAAFRRQGIEAGNGKAFRDCPDCPEMVLIPAGSFDMGSNIGIGAEKPVHYVAITKPFAMGKTEVTQGQWRAIMGNNPSKFTNCGDNCPVEQVSWNDANAFIQKLNAKTGKQYRLPSEAEWEYACRAGGKQEYCGSDNVDSVAWYDASSTHKGNSTKSVNPVATKQANAFGLYDMSGNVEEWMEDSYHDSYNGAPTDGSAWQGDGVMRVVRGGSWLFISMLARAAYRNNLGREYYNNDVGFRLARMLP